MRRTNLLSVCSCALLSGVLFLSACCGGAGGDANSCKGAAIKTDDLKKVIRAQVSVKPEQVGAFIDFTRSLIEQSRAEEGNISYTMYQNPSDTTRFIFFEEWKNQAAIDFHFNTEHYKGFREKVGEYSSAPSEVNIYDVISEK